MPEMDGITALKEIKQFDASAKSLCAQRWDNNQWLLMPFKQVQKTLS